jgi:hypothetical protein
LLNDDYSPKPAYTALESLINHKLSTTIDGLSNAQGHYAFRGFHGQYEITITNQAGGKAIAVINLSPLTNQCLLVVENADLPGIRIQAAQ